MDLENVRLLFLLLLLLLLLFCCCIDWVLPSVNENLWKIFKKNWQFFLFYTKKIKKKTETCLWGMLQELVELVTANKRRSLTGAAAVLFQISYLENIFIWLSCHAYEHANRHNSTYRYNVIQGVKAIRAMQHKCKGMWANS